MASRSARDAARGGDRDQRYLPEVASKLRLLLVRSKQNKALLFEVMDRFGLQASVTLSGPPGLKNPPGHNEPLPGDRITLDAFFDLLATTIRTADGLVNLTKRELIRAFAEQLGGAHADWSVDEAILKSLSPGVLINGMPPIVIDIRSSTWTTLRYGRELVALARGRLRNGPTT